MDLRSPVLGDQQHVATLNGVLVEDQNVVVVDPIHLQPRVPGKERIGLWPLGSVMFGECGIQLSQFELVRTGS